MHVGESTKDYTLMAHASDEVDAAWEDLLSDFFTEVPYSYVASVGRLDTSIPSTNGGFIATYTFMHQLHCLKRLHHSYWPDRYFPNTTADQKADILEHNLHCLQMMLTAIKCHADPVPETIRWVEESPYPFGNRSSKHECVNWEVLMKEMKRKRVDPFTPGLLVHPIYGPALGEGRGTVLDEGFRLKFVVGGTTVKVGGE
ncbi:hypothetical protein EJ04DRAFT_536861 [Polyplosphaeria fusca]|uniref:Uncharacterized protein n=1 Tax=Polyplosphaeria fusca TaxID=682080 RepID=A0A9P4UWH5_9PLEO|nr:hypothetical protein EJ04DRAFT_536861 [Polyplosphaeria fusca]